jgi:hypothetical protein
MEISFGLDGFDTFNSPYKITLDSLIDVVFFIDIIFRFRTTYIDPISGEEIMDSLLITKRYIFSSNFVQDILSTLPINVFVEDGPIILELLGLLKILRVFRISSVIMNANTS